MGTETVDLHKRFEEALALPDDQLASALAEIRAADIAEAFTFLPDEDRSRILFALPPHTAAEVVILLDEVVQGEVVDELDTRSLTDIVAELEPDDAADVLSALPVKVADQVLEQLDDAKSDKIEELLTYDESTAGGIMTPDVIAVPGSATVGDAIERVREASENEDVHGIYLIDDASRLVGTVSLRDLVTNPLDTPLSELAEPDPVTVSVDDDQETVLQVIRKYDVPEAAVIDEHDRLIGRVTHDDVIEVAAEEAEEDLLHMAGTDVSELETHSPFEAARIRLSWLLPCMLVTMITAAVLRLGEHAFEVTLFAALAPFVPLIGAIGGNSGIQISTIIVRGFSTGDFAASRLKHVVAREWRIGVVMAPVCGVTAFLLAAMLTEWHVAAAVGFAMTAAILTAGALGIALPFIFRRIGVDPAIASGPLITTLNDMISITIFMLVALAILT